MISYPMSLTGLAGAGPVAGAMTIFGMGGAQVAVSCASDSLRFAGSAARGGRRGGRPPAPTRRESCAVTTSPAGLGVSLSVATTSGGSWLVAALNTHTAPARLTASVNATGLASGTYQGSIVVSAAGATPVTVPVTLKVSAGLFN